MNMKDTKFLGRKGGAMTVVLAGQVETATFQAAICSTEGLVGRGAKKPISSSAAHQVGITGKGQRELGKVPNS